MKLAQFYDRAWKSYAAITPDAPKIHSLLSARGEKVINDHIAIRTFNIEGIGRLELGKHFETMGYQRQEGDLDFPEKKLKATYWCHPDKLLPKIFISELLLEKCNAELSTWVRGFAKQKSSAELFFERGWDPVRFEDYSRFYPMSEYAAWTAAFGICINHFTVFINELKTFDGIVSLNGFLKQNGFQLNSAGGEIKGSRSDCLEQSSTLARRIPWQFADGNSHEVMSCYYEFALRYPKPGSKELFQGFVPESANKIFESTFERN